MPWGDIIPFAAILLAFAVILSYAYAYSHPIEKPCPVVYSNLSNLTSNQTANNSKNITIKLGLPANNTTAIVKPVKATVTPTPTPKPTATPTPTPKPTATPQWVRVLFFTQPGCSICAQDDPVMNQLMMSGYHVTYLTPQNNSDMFKQFGVSTTPTIVVNGDKGARTIYGVVTYDQVVATINEVY